MYLSLHRQKIIVQKLRPQTTTPHSLDVKSGELVLNIKLCWVPTNVDVRRITIVKTARRN